MTDATCWACGRTLPLRDLLEVRDLADESKPPWHLCRPSVPGGPGDCLRRGAGSAARYSVHPAVPEPIRRNSERSLPLNPSPRVTVSPRPAPATRHDVVYGPGRVERDRA